MPEKSLATHNAGTRHGFDIVGDAHDQIAVTCQRVNSRSDEYGL